MTTESDSPWATDGEVRVEVADAVATLTFARGPGNGWTPRLGQLFFGAVEKVADDPGVRAIVVTGAGKDFCVGADSGGLDNVVAAGSFTASPGRPDYWLPLTVGKPLIAAVNGACFGVGVALSLMCDLRFAGKSTKFATAFVRRGLIGELGVTWMLPRVVGLGVANDLLLSGRVVRAEEAHQIGLVNQVIEDEHLVDAATDYARALAATSSPAAMAVLKRQTLVDLTSTLPESVARADRYMEQAMASEDFAEGVSSWLDRRPPAFPALGAEKSRFELPGESSTDDAGTDES